MVLTWIDIVGGDAVSLFGNIFSCCKPKCGSGELEIVAGSYGPKERTKKLCCRNADTALWNRNSVVHYGFGLNVQREQRHGQSRTAQRRFDQLMRSIAGETYSELTPEVLCEVIGDIAPKHNREPYGRRDLFLPGMKAVADRLKGDCEPGDWRGLVPSVWEAEVSLGKIRDVKVKDIVNEERRDDIEKLFNAAAASQFKLAAELREVAGKHRGAGDFSLKLEDLSLKCDSRGSEILTLFTEIRTFGEESLIGDYAFLNARTADLLKGMAGSMHGNYHGDHDVNDEVVGEIESGLEDIARGCGSGAGEGFSGNTVDKGCFNDFGEKVRKYGRKLRESETGPVMDPDIRSKLTEHLDGFRNTPRVLARRRSLGAIVNRGIVEKDAHDRRKMAEVGGEISKHKDSFPVLSEAFEILKKCVGGNDDEGMIESATRLYEFLGDERRSCQLQDEVQSFAERCGLDKYDRRWLGGVGARLLMVRRVADEMCKRPCVPTSGEDVVNAFLRNGKFSMLFEARVNGADEDMLDPRLCDRNVIGDEPLGKGHLNAVRKLTYRVEGRTRVFAFKADLGGRVGIHRSVIGSYGAYAKTQQCVKLNMAVCAVAELLGLGRLVVECHATVHDGQYGLLMERAPGRALTNGDVKWLRDLAKSQADKKYCGAVVRAFNDLSWLYKATGNGDGTVSNILVDLDKDSRERPRVTSIDYDLSFPSYLVGVGRFNVHDNNDRWKAFCRMVKQACVESCPQTGEARCRMLCGKIARNGFIVDVNRKEVDKEILYALSRALGFRSVKIPKQMSRELCERLKRLSDDRIMEFAREKLEPNIDKRDAVEATVQRLRDLRGIAIRYDDNEGGAIIEDEDWQKEEVLERETCCDIGLGDNPTKVDKIAFYVSAGLLARYKVHK